MAARPDESTAETLLRWRTRLDNAASLTGDAAVLLADAGWTTARLGKARDLVEAYAQADVAQQAAIRAAQEALDQPALDQAALRAWYTTAAALCKRAIKDADPQNHQQLMELLEL